MTGEYKVPVETLLSTDWPDAASSNDVRVVCNCILLSASAVCERLGRLVETVEALEMSVRGQGDRR